MGTFKYWNLPPHLSKLKYQRRNKEKYSRRPGHTQTPALRSMRKTHIGTRIDCVTAPEGLWGRGHMNMNRYQHYGYWRAGL